MTPKELAEFVVAETKQYVEDTLARSIARLEASFAEQVDRAVEARIKALPSPEPGPPGKDGVDGKDGRDGIDGKDGRDGVDGKDGVDGQPGEKGLDGKDGRDGVDGKDGVQGVQGEKGMDGINGKDGAPGADGPVGKRGEKGERGEKGIDGRDGREGKDGRDGITEQQLNDGIIKGLVAALEELHMDGRELKIGDRLIAKLAIPEDRGVYQADTDYEPGDVVSFGGSGWICKRVTRDKPGTSDAWRLMIKKGRDGRDNDPRPPHRGPVKQ